MSVHVSVRKRNNVYGVEVIFLGIVMAIACSVKHKTSVMISWFLALMFEMIGTGSMSRYKSNNLYVWVLIL